jgi:hypothetical protein
MDFVALGALLTRKRQRFICSPAGEDSGERFVAHITHQVTEALELAKIQALERKIGRHDELFQLLTRYGSIRLFCDTRSSASAFYIAHPNEWEALHADFRPWIDDYSAEEKGEMFPDWVDDLLTIGEVPHSGNYFLLAVKGKEKGKVFEFEHAENDFIEAGADFNAFVSSLCTVTGPLLERIGTHTRYSDGTTDIQWFPERYEYDL